MTTSPDLPYFDRVEFFLRQSTTFYENYVFIENVKNHNSCDKSAEETTNFHDSSKFIMIHYKDKKNFTEKKFDEKCEKSTIMKDDLYFL